MSHLNNKNINTRCTRQVIENADFCKYHIRTKKYFHTLLDDFRNTDKQEIKTIFSPINYKLEAKLNNAINKLDENYTSGLLGIYDSWKEVPSIYWIYMDNTWWDIRLLVSHFSTQLCNSDMENPSPSFPSNPYNRKNFSLNDLKIFKDKIKNLNIKIYIGLAIFLTHVFDDFKTIKINECETSHKLSLEIINLLSKSLRFKLINYKNSQDCYCGIWVYNMYPFSNFELLYKNYNDLPIQQLQTTFYGNFLVNNPVRYRFELILNTLPKEEYDLTKDFQITL
jgi:hypothetical protein